MTIYKKYVWRKRKFRFKSEKSYKNFLIELKRMYLRGRRSVTADELHFFIRRHSYLATAGTLKRNWNEKARRYYFKFWIKRAEGAGFLVNDGFIWFITPKILKVKE